MKEKKNSITIMFSLLCGSFSTILSAQAGNGKLMVAIHMKTLKNHQEEVGNIENTNIWSLQTSHRALQCLVPSTAVFSTARTFICSIWTIPFVVTDLAHINAAVRHSLTHPLPRLTPVIQIKTEIILKCLLLSYC